MISGHRISERLEQLGMSQAELGRRVGIDQSTINGLVNGKARSSRYLHLIARVLKTTPAYLTNETDDSEADAPDDNFSAEERDWVELLRDLQDEQRRALITIARSMVKDPPSRTLHDRNIEFHTEA